MKIKNNWKRTVLFCLYLVSGWNFSKIIEHCQTYLMGLNEGPYEDFFQKERFSIGTLNANGLYNEALKGGLLSAHGRPLTKLAFFERFVREQELDILVVQETTREQLEEFSRNYLSNLYKPLVIGNLEHTQDEGKQIGFLVKRSLPISFKLEADFSTKFYNRFSGNQEALFGRGLHKITLFLEGRRYSRPLMAIYGGHYKAQAIASKKHDAKRCQFIQDAQIDFTVEQVRQDIEKYGETFPVFVAADFNQNLLDKRSIPQLRNLLVDSASVLGETPNRRATHFYKPTKDSEVRSEQLDGILMRPCFLGNKADPKTLIGLNFGQISRKAKRRCGEHSPVVVSFSMKYLRSRLRPQ